MPYIGHFDQPWKERPVRTAPAPHLTLPLPLRTDSIMGLTPEFTDHEVEEFKEAFRMFDMDGNGHIESRELADVMGKLGEVPKEEEIQDMIFAVDQNGDGQIDFEEFLGLMALRRMELKVDPEAALRTTFDVFDADGSGYIDREEVRLLMKKFAQTLTDEEIDAIMSEGDKDGDGEISFEEFKDLMFS